MPNDICGSFSVCFPASCGNDCSSQSPCVKCLHIAQVTVETIVKARVLVKVGVQL